MAFTVNFTRRAEAQLAGACNFVREQAGEATTQRWLSRFKTAILSLEHFPLRYPLAPEARKHGFPYRRFHVGRRRGTFLVYYKVTPSGKDDGTVTIIHIRRAMRDKPDATDFLE